MSSAWLPRPPHVGLAVGAALVVNALAAAASLDRGATAALPRLVFGCLVLNVLVLASARGAAASRRAAGRARQRRLALLSRGALAALGESALVGLLAAPALALAWEVGAAAASFAALALALVAAALCGAALSFVVGLSRLDRTAVALVGAALAAALMWPASLGFAAGQASFPGLDTSPILLLAVLAAAVASCAASAGRPMSAS